MRAKKKTRKRIRIASRPWTNWSSPSTRELKAPTGATFSAENVPHQSTSHSQSSSFFLLLPHSFHVIIVHSFKLFLLVQRQPSFCLVDINCYQLTTYVIIFTIMDRKVIWTFFNRLLFNRPHKYKWYFYNHYCGVW